MVTSACILAAIIPLNLIALSAWAEPSLQISILIISPLPAAP
jgi:hypothetical protein